MPQKTKQEQVRSFLENISIFKNTKEQPELFEKLIKNIKIRHYQKLEPVYTQGEPSTVIYLVMEGAVKIIRYKPITREAETVAFHRRSSIFGEVSILSGKEHSSDAIAALDSMVCIISKKMFLELIEKDIKTANHIAKLLSLRSSQVLDGFQERREFSKIHFLTYPESPKKGNEICHVLANSINSELTGKVLFVQFPLNFTHKLYATEKPNISFPTIFEKLDQDLTEGYKYLQSICVTKYAYDVLNIQDVFNSNNNLNKIAAQIPSFFSFLCQFYSSILVDGCQNIQNPIMGKIILQSDKIIFIQKQKGDALNGLEQKEDIWKFLLEDIDTYTSHFYDRVIMVSDINSLSKRNGNNGSQLNSMDNNVYSAQVRIFTANSKNLLTFQNKTFLKGIRGLARILSETSLALVLSGGGSRALAHLGALQVLSEEGIEFDAIAGVSMGAVIACVHILDDDAIKTKNKLIELFTKHFSILDPTLPIESFFKGKKLTDSLTRIFGQLRFEDLDIPFYCIASDLVSGEVIVFEQGPIVQALRASVGLPIFFPPVKIGSSLLVDGGVLNNLPGDILRQKGYNKILGISPSIIKGDWKYLEKRKFLDNPIQRIWNYFSIPPILRVIERTMYIQSKALMKYQFDYCNYLLEIELTHERRYFGFDRIEKFFEIGRSQTEKQLPQLKEALLVKH